MPHRKFKDIEYPVPGVDTALEILCPGAKYDIHGTEIVEWEDDEGRKSPTWAEIESEILREVDIYNYYLYERNREKNYPDWKTQLDLLYHDLKNNNLNNGTWIKTIESVKEKYPKPQEPAPEL